MSVRVHDMAGIQRLTAISQKIMSELSKGARSARSRHGSMRAEPPEWAALHRRWRKVRTAAICDRLEEVFSVVTHYYKMNHDATNRRRRPSATDTDNKFDQN